MFYPGVLLSGNASSDAVESVELVELDQLLSKLNPSGRVTDPVQGRRVESEADNVGDDEDDDPTDPGLGRETDLECELPAVVVHPAAVHQAEHVLHGVAGEDPLPGDGADPPVSQGPGQHGHAGSRHLDGAGLDVEVQDVLDIHTSALVVRSAEERGEVILTVTVDSLNLLREAAGLPHEVGQGVVPVRRVSLREEGGVLEAWSDGRTRQLLLVSVCPTKQTVVVSRSQMKKLLKKQLNQASSANSPSRTNESAVM